MILSDSEAEMTASPCWAFKP